MKVKAKIWYPVITTVEKEIEIDILDNNNDIDNFLFSHEKKILIKHGADEYGLDSAIDVDYAGVKLIKNL